MRRRPTVGHRDTLAAMSSDAKPGQPKVRRRTQAGSFGGPAFHFSMLRPHGFKERVPPLENLEHAEVNRAEPEQGPESSDVQL